MKIGYARVSTRLTQDTIHQERALLALGIDQDRIYTDQGFTGSNTNRPGLREAMAALRSGDELAVTKLDRLARSVSDAHRLASEITAKGAKLRIGDSLHDPSDPMGKLLFTCLAMIAEFEKDLISLRTKEGLETARLKGRLRGRPPKLTPNQEKALVAMVREDTRTLAEVAEIFGVGRATVGRALQRAGVRA